MLAIVVLHRIWQNWPLSRPRLSFFRYAQAFPVYWFQYRCYKQSLQENFYYHLICFTHPCAHRPWRIYERLFGICWPCHVLVRTQWSTVFTYDLNIWFHFFSSSSSIRFASLGKVVFMIPYIPSPPFLKILSAAILLAFSRPQRACHTV